MVGAARTKGILLKRVFLGARVGRARGEVGRTQGKHYCQRNLYTWVAVQGLAWRPNGTCAVGPGYAPPLRGGEGWLRPWLCFCEDRNARAQPLGRSATQSIRRSATRPISHSATQPLWQPWSPQNYELVCGPKIAALVSAELSIILRTKNGSPSPRRIVNNSAYQTWQPWSPQNYP